MSRALDPRFLALALRASQTLELGAFLDLCAEGLGDLLGPEAVHAYARSGEGPDLGVVSSWTGRRMGARRAPAMLDGRLLSTVGPEGRRTDGRSLRPGVPGHGGFDDEPVLLLPLGASRGADEASGLFLVIRGQERPEFLDSDLEDAREFLGLVSPAMANIQTVSELRETAVRDDLAGCYNRRHFETFLAEEIARARRFRTRVSIVFFDMDNLKSVNTAHGHTMGSRSLQEVSERIDGRIRKIDKLFRFGGDEFCVILPETDTRGARHAAERARKAIAESPVLAAEVGGVGMTASLGIATFPDHAGSAEDLVQAADRAMQSVKRGGKNGIGVAVRAEPVAPGSGGAAGSAGAPRAPLEGKA